MRNVLFHQTAFNQLSEWIRENPKIALKIVELIEDVSKEPFTGLGKPEPLKYELKGCWSRRITSEHRLVYYVTTETITILSCRYHY